MANNEQTMSVDLCYLLPFGEKHMPSKISIVDCEVHFRYNELIINNSELVLPIDTDARWTNLAMFNNVCGLRAIVMKVNDIITNVHGILVRLFPAAIIELYAHRGFCNPELQAFETALGDALEGHDFLLPLPTSKVSRQQGISRIEATQSVKICDGIYWSFQKNHFSGQYKQPAQVEIIPTWIVSEFLPDRKQILDYLNQPNEIQVRSYDAKIQTDAILIITETLENHWAGPDARIVGSKGIAMQDLHMCKVFLASPKILVQNMESMIDLIDSVRDAYTILGKGTIDYLQTERLLVDQWSRGYPTFSFPVGFLKFHTILFDQVLAKNAILDPLDQSFVQLIVDKSACRPMGLTRSQCDDVLRPQYPKWIVSVTRNLINISVRIFWVPKEVLRKIKFHLHPVKQSQIESKIAKCFGSRHCPLSHDTTLQRFSEKPIPQDLAMQFVKEHFNRVGTSLGEFVTVSPDQPAVICPKFVLSIMQNVKENNCSICFESVTNADQHIGICGHVYCTDCKIQHFQATWAQNVPKECAVCRCMLLQGDMFFIKEFTPEAPFLSVLPTKDLTMDSYKQKVKHCQTFKDAKTEMLKTTKHIITSTMDDITIPEVLAMASTKPLHLHFFYTQAEAPKVHAFVHCF